MLGTKKKIEELKAVEAVGLVREQVKGGETCLIMLPIYHCFLYECEGGGILCTSWHLISFFIVSVLSGMACTSRPDLFFGSCTPLRASVQHQQWSYVFDAAFHFNELSYVHSLCRVTSGS